MLIALVGVAHALPRPQTETAPVGNRIKENWNRIINKGLSRNPDPLQKNKSHCAPIWTFALGHIKEYNYKDYGTYIRCPASLMIYCKGLKISTIKTKILM